VDFAASQDHYAVLGIERGATAAEIRRAYRKLALRLHPDRAGTAATERFQQLARSYGVLANAVARAAYDAATSPRAPGAATTAAVASAAGPRVRVIARLAASLAVLLERGVARRRDGGFIELGLLPEEAREGGTAAIGVPLRVPCPTCGGCAQPNELWCARCEFAGAIDDEVTVALAIPPAVADGATFTIRFDDVASAPPLRVRVRRVGSSANW
jgi:molecular chaperone DnaJ